MRYEEMLEFSLTTLLPHWVSQVIAAVASQLPTPMPLHRHPLGKLAELQIQGWMPKVTSQFCVAT
jgi:hypothetical protein